MSRLFAAISPKRVKSGENYTFLVNSTHFHENGWNFVKIGLFTPKSPFGRRRAPKHQETYWFRQYLGEGRRRAPLWAPWALFTKLGEKW